MTKMMPCESPLYDRVRMVLEYGINYNSNITTVKLPLVYYCGRVCVFFLLKLSGLHSDRWASRDLLCSPHSP